MGNLTICKVWNHIWYRAQDKGPDGADCIITASSLYIANSDSYAFFFLVQYQTEL